MTTSSLAAPRNSDRLYASSDLAVAVAAAEFFDDGVIQRQMSARPEKRRNEHIERPADLAGVIEWPDREERPALACRGRPRHDAIIRLPGDVSEHRRNVKQQ